MHKPTNVTQSVNFFLKTLCFLGMQSIKIILALKTTVTLATVRCPEALQNFA